MADNAISAWVREGAAFSEDGDGVTSAWSDNPDGEFSWAADSGNCRSGRRGLRLLALAVVPWLMVFGLMTARWQPSQHPHTALSPSDSTMPSKAVVAHQPDNAEHPMTLTNRTTSSSRNALDSELGTTAATTVQQALTGTDQASARSRYINLALPEAITWVGDIAIVNVAAVVLEGTGGRWGHPRAARYAVPLQIREGVARVLSAPWVLPDPPQAAPGGTAFASVSDLALTELAGQALRSAGYRNVQVRALARDPGLPGVLKVEVTGISPGEGEARLQEIWLSDQPSPTVLGTSASKAHSAAPPQPAVGTKGGAR